MLVIESAKARRTACIAESTPGGKTYSALQAKIEYEYRFAEYEYEHDSIGAFDERCAFKSCALKRCVSRCAVDLVRSKLRSRIPAGMLVVGVNDLDCPGRYPAQESGTRKGARDRGLCQWTTKLACPLLPDRSNAMISPGRISIGSVSRAVECQSECGVAPAGQSDRLEWRGSVDPLLQRAVGEGNSECPLLPGTPGIDECAEFVPCRLFWSSLIRCHRDIQYFAECVITEHCRLRSLAGNIVR